jgi:hypothetical protein
MPPLDNLITFFPPSRWGIFVPFLGTFISSITETEYLQYVCSWQDFSVIYSTGEGTSTSSSWFPAVNEKERNPCNKYVDSSHLFWKLFRPKFSAPQCYRTWRKIIFISGISNTNLTELHKEERRPLLYLQKDCTIHIRKGKTMNNVH